MISDQPRPLSASSKVLALLVLSSGLGYGLQSPQDMVHGPNADGICTSEPFFPSRAIGSEEAPPADYVISVNPAPLAWNINGQLNPHLTLTRGHTYIIDLSAVGGQHPFVINSNSADAGGTIYAGPASLTSITFTPDNTMPATIYYHCQVHFTLMFGTIDLVEPSPADFIVSVNPSPLSWTVNGQTNPTLTLTRGQTYTFDLTAVPGQHPFVINRNSSDAGGTIYAGPASATTLTFTPDNVMPATMYYHCQVHFTLMFGTINLISPPLAVSVKAFLEGAYDSGTGSMRDNLRAAGLVPAIEPYTALGYTHVSGNGGATVAPAVLAVTGNDAIVDWVLVELRDNTTPAVRLQTRCALIQRDGDVVSTDGTSPVQFTLAAGTYRVAIRHRSHLGAMTLGGFSLSSVPTTVNFTSPATSTFGTNATKAIGAVQVLWMGDATFDGSLLYTGGGNDRDPILVGVGGTTPNNSISGYFGTDLNMDGSVMYTGTGNDRDPILINVGSTTPNNTRVQQLP